MSGGIDIRPPATRFIRRFLNQRASHDIPVCIALGMVWAQIAQGRVDPLGLAYEEWRTTLLILDAYNDGWQKGRNL